ncbi:MAG: hypothetical protein AAGA10_21720 [Bacteroidota bacterium]
MALAVLTIACFMLYSTSRFFPVQDMPIVKTHKVKVLVLASAISLFSLYLFSRSFGFETGLMIWMIAFMTLLSAVILSIKMNLKWIWVWGGLCILFMLIDIV